MYAYYFLLRLEKISKLYISVIIFEIFTSILKFGVEIVLTLFIYIFQKYKI